MTISADSFYRDAHNLATTISDILFVVGSSLFIFSSEIGDYLVIQKPRIEAFGALVFVLTLCVRLYISIRDAAARRKIRSTDQRHEDIGRKGRRP